MTRFIALFGVLFGTLLFSGCASVSKQATNQFPEPKPDKALIYFYREAKMVGAMISYNIRHNEQIIGALANGTYFYYEVEPGTHTFIANTEAKSSRTLTVEAGKTYYVAGRVEMGVLAGRPALSIENEQEAKSVLPTLKYAIK